MPKKSCPSRDELSGYVQGTLPPSQAETVTVHLANCADCEDTIHRLESTADPLIDQIRGGPEAQPYVDEAACRKVVESVERLGPQAGGPAHLAERSVVRPVPEQVRPMNRTEFVEFLTTTGFVAVGELTAVEKQLPPAEATDVQALARTLVAQGKLTKYQAAAVYQGKGKSLVYGDYLVLDRIGAGGMGQVYKARHKRMDRIVALKVLSIASMKNADAVKRFEREVRAAAKLIHPNIVHAYDAGLEDGAHYLVMEFVDGPDLSSLVKKQGKLSVREACEFIVQAARGFAFAHGKGIVHRDIKPGNLLVDRDGTVKVLDMGLARFDDLAGSPMSEGELTQSGTVMGTVDYMAPEQALNTSLADAKSDVYSLGCTLFRLLTGEAVYGGQSMVEKILAHREQPVPSLRRVRPDAPPALERLIARMLAKSPADRPSMQEIADALAAIGAGGPVPAGQVSAGLGMPTAAPFAPPAVSVARPAAPSFGPSIGPPSMPGHAPSRTKGAIPPRRRWNTGMAAAAAAGAVFVALGVWVYINNNKGERIAEVQVPDGSTVVIVPDATSSGTATPPALPSGTVLSATVPSGTAPNNPAPINIFLPPAGTPSATATIFTTPSPVAPAATSVAAAPTATLTSSTVNDLWIDSMAENRDPPIVQIQKFTSSPTEPMTVEAWCYPTVPPVLPGAAATTMKPIERTHFGFGTRLGVKWEIDPSKPERDNRTLAVYHQIETGGTSTLNVTCGKFVRGIPQHVALTIAPLGNGMFRLTVWVDGKLARSLDTAYEPHEAHSLRSHGGIDELRISRGIRYTSDFTPQRRFEPDADTLGLYHCDEGTGTRLVDAAGSQHGKLIDAKWLPVATPPATVVPAVATGPVDLLALVDLNKHIVHGTWTRVGGELIGGKIDLARVQIPVTPPAEYDVTVTARHVDGADPWLSMGLIAAGRQFFIVLGEKECRICVDGTTANKYRSSGVNRPAQGPFTVRYSVRKDSVAVELDGNKVLEYRDDLNRLLSYDAMKVPRSDQLFIGMNVGGNMAISAVQLTPLNAIAAPSAVAPITTDPAIERQIAVQLQGRGCNLQVAVGDRRINVGNDSQKLPNEAFRVTHLGIPGTTTCGDADMQLVRNLTSLEKIDIGGPNVTDAGLAPLATLTNLEEVAVNYGQIDGQGLVHLAGLPKLRKLNLKANKPTDATLAASLPRLAMLEELSIVKPAITNVRFVTGMPKLKRLHVGETRLVDLSGVETLADLEYLSVFDSRVVDASLAPIARLTKLRELIVYNTSVSDAGLVYFEKLTGLESLNAAKSFVTAEGAAALQAKLPGCKVVSGETRSGTPPKTGPLPAVPQTPIAMTPPAFPTGTAVIGGSGAGSRQPVPGTAERQAALQLIKNVFKDDYAAAKTPAKKSELAGKLYEQSRQAVDATEKYVLLDEALTLGADGDEVDNARRALKSMVEEFDVGVAMTYVGGWKALLTKARPPEVVRALLSDANQVFDGAVKTAQFDDAKAIGDFATTTAQRLRDVAEIKLVRDRNAELVGRQKEHAAAKAAIEKLASTPDDPEANLAVGRYRALVEKDWANALPLLAKGSDAVWKELAAKTLAAGNQPAALSAVADAWWDAAQVKPAQKAELLAGARFWYQAAIGSLAGLQKTRVENRITEAGLPATESKIPITLLPLPASAVAPPVAVVDDRPVMPVRTFGDPSPTTRSSPTPVAPANATLADPAFQQWMRSVAAMSAEQQAAAVSRKLAELNPGFEEKNFLPTIEAGVVTRLRVISDRVRNIAPVRALVGLQELGVPALSTGDGNQSGFSDLSPLVGMNLTSFNCVHTSVSDLTPLRGMPLTTLTLRQSNVMNLSPLAGMRLTNLSAGRTKVTDLSPLAGMPLTQLDVNLTPVSDFSPLFGCKDLKTLDIPSRASPEMVEALRRALPNCKID